MSLQSLLAAARANEQKLARLQAMELRLINATSLEALCAAIVVEYPEDFGLSTANLFLFDWDGALGRFLEQAEVAERPGVQVLDAARAEEITSLCGARPWLGGFQERLHGRHFPHGREHLRSVALLPLVRRGSPIGLLALGSEERSRFDAQLGTEFLQRLGVVIALCIENSLNYERLRQLGLRDPLTHLYNRRYFLERLQQAMNVAMRSGQSISCIYLDIDHFKQINDGHGHPAGDAVLCEVARRISRELRAGELVARLGGEEFAVLLAGAALGEALAVARRIRESVGGRPIALTDDTRRRLTLSGGVAEWQPQRLAASREAADDLLARADRALLLAKELGRDRIVADE